ncbi:hypothetical protein D3C77_586980 [compost metagenome]
MRGEHGCAHVQRGLAGVSLEAELARMMVLRGRQHRVARAVGIQVAARVRRALGDDGQRVCDLVLLVERVAEQRNQNRKGRACGDVASELDAGEHVGGGTGLR